jgi:AraC-like DNA-binding protein
VRTSPGASAAGDGRREDCRALVVGPDRAAYVGLLGAPAWRVVGGTVIYGALARPFRIRTRAEGWAESDLAVLPPETPHRIESEDRCIGCLLVEAESVARGALPAFLRDEPGRRDPAFRERILAGFQLLPRVAAGLGEGDLDRLFFGHPLPGRRLDPRIALAAARVKADPSGPLDARSLAEGVGLSFHRFLHLFTLECGTPFRRFRMWKRARSFLLHVARDTRMTDVALDVGYPDAAHFSRSIRRCYGLTPSDIAAGSRGLPVFVQAG